LTDYLIGYGSLLSSFSRKHYSNINAPVQALLLKGWQRSWCARYADEGATYLGALPNSKSALNGVLIPTKIDPALAHREREYRFTEVDHGSIRMIGEDKNHLTEKDTVYICESLKPLLSNQDNPVPQSYVDTCMIGCLEAFGESGTIDFIEHTADWDQCWVNDRTRHPGPIYQRLTPSTPEQTELIDQLLTRAKTLQYRS